MTLTYNPEMISASFRLFFVLFISGTALLVSCVPRTIPPTGFHVPDVGSVNSDIPPGFAIVDGSHSFSFPRDLGAHEDFRTEWWYYTGNLETSEGRHFGFELTVFRVGLLPPTVTLPADSEWYNHSVYLAHFAVSDISSGRFYAFDRYSRPGPGLAGAQSDPYRVWLDAWSITEQNPGAYHLQAAEATTAIDLTLTDEMGIILHGENGYSRKGQNITNASYYYSQPRLQANGFVRVKGVQYKVSGLAWNDHEFSSSVLDKNQIGWDWFSLQFEDGSALMLFQLREREGGISASSSGTFISKDRIPQTLQKEDFEITALKEWHSPHTQGIYPAAWKIRLKEPNCLLEVQPWMADQEINFPSVTYWEGAVRFEGSCKGSPVTGNGYVELTGYAGHLPLP